MKLLATMTAAALAVVLQGGFGSAHAANAAGHCTGMTVTDFVSSDADDSTNLMTFVNVADGHLNFSTSGTGCVMITFSGEAIVYPPGGGLEYMRVRTLLDGSSLCVPALTADIFWASGDPSPRTANSITHICKNVAAGNHTVQVQYSSGYGNYVEIIGHVLTITHN
jgi:hypothetical protein